MSRGSVSEARTDDEAQLFFSDSLEADAALCRAARTAWANNCGAPRQSPLVRLDTGKRKAEDPFSEATFLKRRRESVESGAASNPAAGSSPAAPKDRVVGIGDWQDSHDKETFQENKRRLRYLEAIKEGTIDPATITDQDVEELAASEALEIKRGKEHAGKKVCQDAGSGRAWHAGTRRQEVLHPDG